MAARNCLAFTLVFMLAMHSCFACYLRSCLTKRSDKPHAAARPCISCMDGKGQCVGPSICCHATLGCIVGGREAETCSVENYLPQCAVSGAACGSEEDGRCVSEGVCCTSESCTLDSSCRKIHG